MNRITYDHVSSSSRKCIEQQVEELSSILLAIKCYNASCGGDVGQETYSRCGAELKICTGGGTTSTDEVTEPLQYWSESTELPISLKVYVFPNPQ